jgi:GNAT superfamily N-acetyltransferase
MLTLRIPEPDEAPALTALCIRSKAVWGYQKDFMDACRDELTLTPADLRSPHVQVVENDGRLIGVVQVTVREGTADLSKLFVDPTQLGTGAGRLLFKWATAAARKAEATILVIEADPCAAGFYRRMGAVDDGTAPSGSIAGRFIPKLKFLL